MRPGGVARTGFNMPGKKFQSLRGTLLLDGGGLGGSCFQRTVVLVCEHSPSGAFGLVLNRISKPTLEDAVDPEIPEPICREPLFNGGPVQEGVLQFLYVPPGKAADPAPGNIMDTVQVGRRMEELEALASGWTVSLKLRLFAGYAGWGPGQLDGELRRGSWLVHPAGLNLIFDVEPAALWRFILKSRPNWQDRLLADAPEDLRSN